jgi:hypothetical protein
MSLKMKGMPQRTSINGRYLREFYCDPHLPQVGWIEDPKIEGIMDLPWHRFGQSSDVASFMLPHDWATTDDDEN